MSLKKNSKVRFVINYIFDKIFIIIQNVISTSNNVKYYISHLKYLKRSYISNDAALIDKRFCKNKNTDAILYPFEMCYSVKCYKNEYPNLEKKIVILHEALFDNLKNIGILKSKCDTNYITLSRVLNFCCIDLSISEISVQYYPWVKEKDCTVSNSQPFIFENTD